MSQGAFFCALSVSFPAYTLTRDRSPLLQRYALQATLFIMTTETTAYIRKVRPDGGIYQKPEIRTVGTV